ncbi:unnamed protein product [Prorocentrum cordatum]|uniref:Uncharacterized protein n=1 Tax=Prorocentrum cordatum TaxID=2364126 RepID=A0ABN9SR15_9DINO|nr:unnamed protein product [Polarella glacialis]
MMVPRTRALRLPDPCWPAWRSAPGACAGATSWGPWWRRASRRCPWRTCASWPPPAFVLAGTSLDLRRFAAVLPTALGLAGWRLAALRLGTAVAAAAVGDGGSPDAPRYWQGFVTQAGISMALAGEVRERFAHGGVFGELVYAALMGQITVNQVIGLWRTINGEEACCQIICPYV